MWGYFCFGLTAVLAAIFFVIEFILGPGGNVLESVIGAAIFLHIICFLLALAWYLLNVVRRFSYQLETTNNFRVNDQYEIDLA